MSPKSRQWLLLYSTIILSLAAITGCRPEREESGRKKQGKAASQSVISYPTDNRLLPLEEINKRRQAAAPTNSSENSAEKLPSQSKPPAKNAGVVPNFSNVAIDKNDTPWIKESDLPQESWEVQYIGDRAIGYLNQRVSPTLTLDKSTLRTDADSELRISRGGQKMEQRLKVGTIEKLNGELQSIHSELTVGDEVTVTEGSVINDVLRLKIVKQGKTSTVNIPWKPEFRGPYAIEQSIKRIPLKPSEQRRLYYFDPIMGQVVEAVLLAQTVNKGPILGGSLEDLLEVNVLTVMGKNVLESRIWVDSTATIQKSFIGVLDLRSFRANASQALAVRDSGELDLMEVTSVPLSRPIDKASAATTIKYRVRSSINSEWSRTLPKSDYQEVSSGDLLTLDVTVRLPSLDQAAESTGENPGDEYLAASQFIQSDDPQVIELADALICANAGTDSVAAKLCRGVYSAISKKDFAKGFLSAAQVAQELQGDCTEHAVLLAALARSQGIPCRLASGLVYSTQDGKPVMAYHMWNELWVANKWIPADAVTGQFPAPPDRIVVTQTALADDNPYNELLDVFKIMGKIQIDLLDVQY
jgi:Transglutaminase-like superfamily